VTALASDNGLLKELYVRENRIPPEEEALLQGVCSAKTAFCVCRGQGALKVLFESGVYLADSH
jgi:hypothetical protein